MKLTLAITLLILTNVQATHTINACICDQDLLGNGFCNEECNNYLCDFDGLDCLVETTNGCLLNRIAYRPSNNYSYSYFNQISDLDIGCNWRISQIIYGSAKQLQFVYDNDGQSIYSPLYFDQSNKNLQSINLLPNEFIIKFTYGDSYYLELDTNLGRNIKIGTTQSTSQLTVTHIPEGQHLVAINGWYYTDSYGTYIYEYDFYVSINHEFYCSCGASVIGDGICTELCNTQACQYDGGDCENPETYSDFTEFCTCPKEFLHNGYCNYECNNQACYWDGLDCAVESNDECLFGALQSPASDRNDEKFSDILDFNISCDWQIKSISAYHSSYIRTFQVVYEYQGQLYTTEKRGSQTLTPLQTFDLNAGEKIINIQGSVADHLNSLKLTTNQDREFSIGQVSGLPFNLPIPDGFELKAFEGLMLDDRITRLTPYVAIDTTNTNPDICPCPAELIGDGICNLECNSEQCQLDGGDCLMESIDQCQFLKVMQHSSATGEKFNDLTEFEVGCNWRVREIHFGDGYGVKVNYDNQGTFVEGRWHSTSSTVTVQSSYYLESHEFITKIYRKLYSTSQYYAFSTNLGRIINSSNLENFYEVPIPNGSYFIGFAGAIGSPIQLDFYVTSIADQYCPCPPGALGDGICTEFCNIEVCNYDGQDCSGANAKRFEQCECDQELVHNGYCNWECNIPECQWDGLDCAREHGAGCSFGLYDEYTLSAGDVLFDSLYELGIGCDWKISALNIYFNSVLKGLQLEYTDSKGKSYITKWYSDGNKTPATYDQYQLEPNEFITELRFYGSANYSYIYFLTNVEREIVYGSYTVSYKALFRLQFPENYPLAAVTGGYKTTGFTSFKFYVNATPGQHCICNSAALGDGICTQACNTEACEYDGGDCKDKGTQIQLAEKSSCPCKKELLGNGYCNTACNKAVCEWDGGDCAIQMYEGCQIVKLVDLSTSSSALGVKFSDLAQTKVSCTQKLQEIRMAYLNSLLIGLQFIYSDKGKLNTGGWYINQALPTTFESYVLKPNEFITHYAYYNTGTIAFHHFYIKTNLGQTFGKLDSDDVSAQYIEIPVGYNIVAFSGHFNSNKYIAGLQIYASVDPENHCPCQQKEKGNGICTEFCNTEGCNFDEDDCNNKRTLYDQLSSCSCDYSLFQNGRCNAECNISDCLWDGMDCTLEMPNNFHIATKKTLGSWTLDDNFNDITDLWLTAEHRISKIDIEYVNVSGYFIRNFRVTYTSPSGEVTTGWRGTPGTAPTSFVTHTLDPNEYITYIWGVFDGKLRALQINTNTRQLLLYGSGQYYVFQEYFNADVRFAGFSGTHDATNGLQKLSLLVDANYGATQALCNCEASLLGDGQCNPGCSNVACNWDGLDCVQESNESCKFAKISSTEYYTTTQATFNDIKALNLDCDSRIAKITFGVYTSRMSLQIDYINGGIIVAGDINFKDTAEIPSYTNEFIFEPNEFLTSIDLCLTTSNTISYIKFRTNLGRSIAGGSTYSCQFKYVVAPQNSHILSFGGVKDSYGIRALDIFAPIIPDTVCPCSADALGDGICTPLCNQEKCNYDGGDCEEQVDYRTIAPFCQLCDVSLLGNGYCNEECNTLECNWDGLDCALESNGRSYFGSVLGWGYGADKLKRNVAKKYTYSGYKYKQYGTDIEDLRIGNSWRLKGIDILYAGSVVKNFRSIYEDERGDIKKSRWRGYYVEPTTYDSYYFQTNEYINRVKGTGYQSIRLETNLGTVIEYGVQNQYAYDNMIPQGYYLAGFGVYNDTSYLLGLDFYLNISDDVYAKNKEYYPGGYQGYGGFNGYDVSDGAGNYKGFGSFSGSGGYSLYGDKSNGYAISGAQTGNSVYGNFPSLLFCKCANSRIGDSNCDEDCFTAECEYDKGDCGQRLPNCPCLPSKLSNGTCEEECNTYACNYDGNDCNPYPNCKCEISLIGNGKCDYSCFNSDCGYDKGDCGEPVTGCDCPPELMGNGKCDQLCNSAVCNYDGWDCTEYPECDCNQSLIRNGRCDFECFKRECVFDGGDCGKPIVDCPCPMDWLMNGECDEVCNVIGCRFDNGACQQLNN